MVKVEELTDVRQLKCLALYKNPKSDTFGNLKQSAIAAGFEESYAHSLTSASPKWLSARVDDDINRVIRAERAIDKILAVDISFDTKNDIDVAKLQFEVAKFVAKTLAKEKYSETEDTTPPNVQINIVNYNAPGKEEVNPGTPGKVRDTQAT